MIARVHGSVNCVGFHHAECGLCAWRRRTWGLRGDGRRVKAQALMDAHLREEHADRTSRLVQQFSSSWPEDARTDSGDMTFPPLDEIDHAGLGGPLQK